MLPKFWQAKLQILLFRPVLFGRSCIGPGGSKIPFFDLVFKLATAGSPGLGRPLATLDGQRFWSHLENRSLSSGWAGTLSPFFSMGWQQPPELICLHGHQHRTMLEAGIGLGIQDHQMPSGGPNQSSVKFH